MSKTLSIIIAVNDAQERDLSIPLSSINNQLGFDFRSLQLLLIDHGQFHLDDTRVFDLFGNLRIDYVETDTVQSWEAAFNTGLAKATGDYVMFMGPDGQLNETSVLQTFMTMADQHPDAEILSGLVLDQDMTKTRTAEYRIGRDLKTTRGRMISRRFIEKSQLRWVEMGAYSDELFSRIALQLAT